jgi:uncharacterized protein YccT (UPF0319 family)
MKSGRKFRRVLSAALSVSLLMSAFPFLGGKAYAAAATPSLNAYQIGNHAKVEWATDIQPADVLIQTGFESGQEMPSLQGGSTTSYGGQSFTSEDYYSPSTSLKIVDTIHNGNAWWYPNTSSTVSRIVLSRKYGLSAGMNLSVTVKAKAVGADATFYPIMDGGPGKYTYPITQMWPSYFTRPVKFSAPAANGSVYFTVDNVDELYNAWVNGGAWISRQASTNYTVAVGYIQSIDRATHTVKMYDQMGLMQNFNAGDQLLASYWMGMGFNGRTIPANSGWNTVSFNAQIPGGTDFDVPGRGLTALVDSITGGTLYIDDIKFGYATQVYLYRDGTQIYNGFLSDFDDTAAIDRTSPSAPSAVGVAVNNRYPSFSWWGSTDYGTTYNYQIMGISQTGSSPMSGNKPVTVTTGVKGYSIVVDTNPNTVPDNVIETTSTSYTLPWQVASNFYVHIAAVDNQGNISSVAHQLYTDTVQPSLSISPSTASWTSGNVTLTATGSDNETGINSMQKPDSAWVAGGSASYVATANGNYGFTSKDNVGNTRSQTYTVSNIDKTAPTQPGISVNPSGWTNSNVTVTLTHGADSQSGVQKSQYRLGAGGAWTNYTGPFAISNEGKTDIYAQTIDNVGNVSAVTSASAFVDKSAPAAPTLTLSNTNWTNQNVSFTIASGADGLSGTAKSQYRIGAGGAWTDYTAPVTVTTEGVTDVYARTLDNVSNASAAVMQTIRIDKTAPSDPSITLSNGTWSQTPVNFTIGGSSDVNAISYEYQIDGGAWTAGTTGTVSKNGVTTITARAKDSVGNVGNVITKNIYVDNQAPTIAITPNGQSWTAEDVPVSIQYADEHSGVDANKRFYKVTNSAASPGGWDAATSNNQALRINTEGIWYVHAKVTDVAGNSIETVSAPIHLQRMPQAPANMRIKQVTETTAQVAFDLPNGSVFTDGYKYQVTNTTTGQTWTIDHPQSSVTDTALEGGKNYTYAVTAINHVGTSAPSTATALTLPKAPENVLVQKIDLTPGQATVTFDPVESAIGYRIMAKDRGNNTVYDQTVTGTVYQPISNLQPGTMYTVFVNAINPSGEGSSRNAGYMSLPAAPGSFTTVQIRENDIRLSWNTVTSATYYGLSRDGFSIYGGPANSFTDSGLQSGTVHSYELFSQNGMGQSPLTSLPNIITLPTKITGLQVTNPTTTSMNLSWNPVVGADQYAVMMNGQPYQTVPTGTTALSVTGLTPGTDYTFDVYAENVSGQGVSMSATSMTIPDTVTGANATTITETGTTLVWAPVTGASKYRVTMNGKTVEVADTQLPITGLTGSTSYPFTVEAGNVSGYGAAASASLLTLPYMPNNLKVTATTETTVGLAWDAVDTATSYVVSQDGAVIGNPTTAAFSVEGLAPGTAHRFEVQAVNTTGTGQATALTRMSKPLAPSSVTPIPNAYKADVSWSPVTGAVQYIVGDGSTELYRGVDPNTTLTGLSDGKTYEFTVRSLNADGTSSDATPFTFLTLPKKPVELGATKIELNTLSLDLSKTQVVGADQYIIERNGEEITRVKTSYKSYMDQELAAGTKYTYTVKAVNASGVGEATSFDVMTKTEPVTAGSIKVEPATNAVTVTWDGMPGSTSFEIRNTVTGDVYSTSGTSATLPNLQDGTKYTFEVTIINGSGVASAPVSFEALTKPAVPQTATVGSVTDTTVVLDLSKSGVRGAAEYIIERDGVEIARVQADQVSFEDKGLTPGTAYTYTVKASNASGVSDSGFNVNAKTLPATVIDKPAASSEISDSSATLTWEAVPGADGYKIVIGDKVVIVTDKTSVLLENLESGKTYDNIRIIPINSAGDGAAFLAKPFDTLPVIAGLVVSATPETDHVTFNWTFPSPNEIFVVTHNGEEVYRGKDKQFVLGGLTAGTVSTVMFHTENASGAKTDEISFSALTKPEAPKQVGYHSTQTGVVLDFANSAVFGAEEFVIERNGVEVGRTSVTSATYEVTGLAPGVQYTYVVKASNGSGVSDTGFTFTTTTLPSTIATPPTPGQPTPSGSDLSWDAVPGALGYKVYIGDKLVATTTETKLNLTDLESAKLYDNVRVVPFNDAGDGEAIAVPAFETLPSGDFTAEAATKSTSQIELKWSLASQNEIFVLASAGKEMYRGKDRSFLWTGLNEGTAYDVQIWTENAGGVKSAAKTVKGSTQLSQSSSGSGSGGGGGGGAGMPSPTPGTPEPSPKPTTDPTPTTEPVKSDIHFVDIASTFNADQITLLAKQGVIQGVTATTFEPQRAITRAEFTALIVRLMDFKTGASYKDTFQDVTPTDWFAPEIAVAVDKGIVTGMGNDIFAPNELVTREQASKIMASVLKSMKPESDVQGSTFADQQLISNWAEGDVQYLVGMQMVNGYEDGTFRPLNDLNRAEAAALIYRLKGFVDAR